MARPSNQSIQVIKDKSVLVMNCGASQTITVSLLNCKEVKQKVTIIETADVDDSMNSTHTCFKTYFVRTRVEEVVTITVPALFVKGLPQDLTTYLIYSGEQQHISESLFLARIFDTVLNTGSSEHFCIVTLSTAHARRKHDLITAHYELATFLSMLPASRCTCIFCCKYLAAVRQCRGPAGALAFSEQVKCTK
jgi:hypothetical protein